MLSSLLALLPALLLPEACSTRLFRWNTNRAIGLIISLHRRMSSPMSVKRRCQSSTTTRSSASSPSDSSPNSRSNSNGLCGVSVRKNAVDFLMQPARVDVAGDSYPFTASSVSVGA